VVVLVLVVLLSYCASNLDANRWIQLPQRRATSKSVPAGSPLLPTLSLSLSLFYLTLPLGFPQKKKRKRNRSKEIVGSNEILAQYANKQQEKK